MKTQVCVLLFEIIISDGSGQQEINKNNFYLSGNSLCVLSAVANFTCTEMLSILKPNITSSFCFFSAITWVSPMWHTGLYSAIVFLLTYFSEGENKFWNTLVMVKRNNLQCKMNRAVQQTCFEQQHPPLNGVLLNSVARNVG